MTPSAALAAARRYVADNRSGCHVAGLLEDQSDYFAGLELDHPNDGWPLGPGPVFIAKETGEVWSDAYGNVVEKIAGMRWGVGASE